MLQPITVDLRKYDPASFVNRLSNDVKSHTNAFCIRKLREENLITTSFAHVFDFDYPKPAFKSVAKVASVVAKAVQKKIPYLKYLGDQEKIFKTGSGKITLSISSSEVRVVSDTYIVKRSVSKCVRIDESLLMEAIRNGEIRGDAKKFLILSRYFRYLQYLSRKHGVGLQLGSANFVFSSPKGHQEEIPVGFMDETVTILATYELKAGAWFPHELNTRNDSSGRLAAFNPLPTYNAWLENIASRWGDRVYSDPEVWGFCVSPELTDIVPEGLEKHFIREASFFHLKDFIKVVTTLSRVFNYDPEAFSIGTREG